MTSPSKQRIKELLTKLSRNDLKVASEIVKVCPECNFALKGQYAKWNGCPECRTPFFQYDAMVNEPVKRTYKACGVLGVSYKLPAINGQQLVPCPECSATRHGSGYYVDQHGDMQDDLCCECFGEGMISQEEHDHIIARNPELAFRLSCLDLIAERLRA